MYEKTLQHLSSLFWLLKKFLFSIGFPRVKVVQLFWWSKFWPSKKAYYYESLNSVLWPSNCWKWIYSWLYLSRRDFKYLLFSPLFGEDFQFDEYFSDGLKPPNSFVTTWVLGRMYWGELSHLQLGKRPLQFLRNKAL